TMCGSSPAAILWSHRGIHRLRHHHGYREPGCRLAWSQDDRSVSRRGCSLARESLLMTFFSNEKQVSRQHHATCSNPKRGKRMKSNPARKELQASGEPSSTLTRLTAILLLIGTIAVPTLLILHDML